MVTDEERHFGEQGLKGEVTVKQEQSPVWKEHGHDWVGCSPKENPPELRNF